MKRDCVICVPARNEAERLPVLLDALAAQDTDDAVKVAICINNSTDGSEAAVRSAVAQAAERIEVRVLTRDFPLELAHAGSARRAAMGLGADWLVDDDALLISTDADCRPPPCWLRANVASAGTKAGEKRIIGGRIELDGREAGRWPGIFALRHDFDAYWQKVREFEDALDPVPWDPPPRHGDHTGASLALSVKLYRDAGGVPLVPTNEDVALVIAAIRAGGRLVHPAEVWTRTSARLVGRADGGMAAEMQRWQDRHKQSERPLVPSYDHWYRRFLWRRTLRPVLGTEMLAVAEADLPPMPCEMPLPESQVA